jgi:hypothetical protein
MEEEKRQERIKKRQKLCEERDAAAAGTRSV